MHGCRSCPRWGLLGASLGWLLAGCSGPPAPVTKIPASPARPTGTHFDAQTAGTIRGRVTWQGEVPAVNPFRVRINAQPGGGPLPKEFHANPHLPAVDTVNGGVRDAVVFLRGIDPERAKPWDLPPVRIEQQGQQFHVRQGDSDSRTGFVRRGDAVVMVSCDPLFHSLHAGGAAFFTLPFPDPGRPLERRLPDRGLVELTSSAGYFWMRGYLFVDDHPYYARTDFRGNFALAGVPPGHYQVVCWLPSWHAARHERDPESGQVTRLTFAPPAEKVQPISLSPGAAERVSFTLSARDFDPR